jgi:hypothetical protein
VRPQQGRKVFTLQTLPGILKVTWLPQPQPVGSSTSAWAAWVIRRLLEQAFMRTMRPVPYPQPVLAKTSCALSFQKPFLTSCYMKDMDATQATAAGIEYLVRKVKGRGGVIVIDKDGNCSSGFTTKKMIHGWIEKGGESNCRF